MTERTNTAMPNPNHVPSACSHGTSVALLVIGMHRSGTSATTGAIQQLGVPLGPKLYRGHKGINAKGYFEHSDIADTNDEILLSLGSFWDDISQRDPGWERADFLEQRKAQLRRFIARDFASDKLWALKDPRIARLLPLWKPLISECGAHPVYLFSLRAPLNVSKSLEKRDGCSRDKAMLLWILHYLEAERESRGQVRTFLDYDTFLEDPVSELENVERRLGIEFPRSPRNNSSLLENFLSKDLRTHRGETFAPTTQIESLATALYDVLHRAAIHKAEPDTSAIDAIDRELHTLYAGFPPLLLEHMRVCAERNGQVQLVLNKILRSWSWVSGKPIRFVERLIGRNV